MESVPWKTAAGSAARKLYSAEGDLVRGWRSVGGVGERAREKRWRDVGRREVGVW